MVCGKKAGAQSPRIRRKNRSAVSGYITIYLVLTLAAMLALYLVLISGARAGAARMQMESVCRISENAVLAEFHREMHRRYDLFMVDTSYGGPGGGNDMLAQHFRSYMDRNCMRKTSLPLGIVRDWTYLKTENVQIPEARYACDNGGQAVREQVYAYMAADPAGAVISEMLVTADQWRGFEISGRDWKEKTRQSTEDVKETMRKKREEQRKENEQKEENDEELSGDEIEAASEETSVAEDMVSGLESFQFLPILHQVFGDTGRLSDRQIDSGAGLCGRELHIGTDVKAENTHGYPEAGEILFDRYIYEKMGSFAKPSEDGKLCYQTEYILCGKTSDRENLEGIAERLLLVREACNCAYLFTDERRMAQVHAVAWAASLILLNPELEEPVSKALALAWSYLESVQDVRTLMAGGRVPIQKSEESWQTHLYDLLKPGDAIRDRDGGEGFDYSDYLQGFLILEGSGVKTQRAMDVMEMDIREITGNSGFRIDYCLDEFRVHAEGSACGLKIQYDGTSGYN